MDYWYVTFDNNKINSNYDKKTAQGDCNPHKKNFACFLVGNGTNGDGAIARVSLFHALSGYKHILSGGGYLNNIGGPLPYDQIETWMSGCKFVISYENTKHNGYITEKLFQAYFSGAIPIYNGDKTVLADVNKDAFIYSDDFNSQDELIEYIKKVDQDDELYCKIWNNNIIKDPEMNYDVVQQRLRAKLFEVIDAKLKD